MQADSIQGSSDVLVAQWQQEFAGEDIAALTLGIRERRVGAPYVLRPTDILKMHSVTSGTVTYRIAQLTKQELAVRGDDPNDRRGYRILLTPGGLKMVDGILHRVLESFRVSLQPMAATPGAQPMLDESLRLHERCIS